MLGLPTISVLHINSRARVLHASVHMLQHVPSAGSGGPQSDALPLRVKHGEAVSGAQARHAAASAAFSLWMMHSSTSMLTALGIRLPKKFDSEVKKSSSSGALGSARTS